MARLPQDALGMETGEPRSEPARPSPKPEGPPQETTDDTLVNDVLSLMDGVVDYLRAIFRLETYRIEVRTRRVVQKALVVVLGASITIFGLVFVSVGVSTLLSEWLQTPYAGPLIVGGVYLVAGVIAIALALRKKEED